MSIHSIRIPDPLDNEIAALMSTGMTRSEIIRIALKQYIAREKFRRLRSKLIPYAEAQGIYTDEDVFDVIS